MPGKYNKEIHHRRTIRLKGYDYSQPGAYLVTICVWQRECLFGDVIDEEMVLSEYGRIVEECWYELPEHYPYLELDAFVIMPNHVHIVIMITGTVGAGLKPALTKRHGIPEIIRALKTFSARSINIIRNTQGRPVWQRNYYEHVIRNKSELFKIRQYIQNNPLSWFLDEENPVNIT